MKPKTPVVTERRTIDGRIIKVNPTQALAFAGRAICVGGDAFGCNNREPHLFRAPTTYDDLNNPAGPLRGIHISKEDVKKCYRCRNCHRFMGCWSCVDYPENIACKYCRDWASDLAAFVHGKIVSPELATHGLRLVNMVQMGKLTLDEFDALWNEARGKAQ